MKTTVGSLLMLAVFAAGCGSGESVTDARYTKGEISADDMDFNGEFSSSEAAEITGFGSASRPTELESLQNQIRPTRSVSTADPEVNRKIIYTANVGLIVSDFTGIEQKIRKLIDDHKGYLANVVLDRMQGERRTGNWTARVPVDQYRSFLDGVAELGVPTSQTQDAQDVTEDYVDLSARLANQKKLEARILELLNRPDDKIQHVIEVEKELARVRQEIEQLQGRLRYLADRTTMTTVHIRAREQRDYVPPQAPNLANRMSSAWKTSVENTSAVSQNILVGLAGSIIPMTIGLVVLTIGWLSGGRKVATVVTTRLRGLSTNSSTGD